MGFSLKKTAGDAGAQRSRRVAETLSDTKAKLSSCHGRARRGWKGKKLTRRHAEKVVFCGGGVWGVGVLVVGGVFGWWGGGGGVGGVVFGAV